jgi:nucleotide-binding universal stress UspA family protein
MKILIPTDFSKDAGEALETAISLASKTKSELVLAHVVKIVSTASVDAMGGIPMSYQIPTENIDELIRSSEEKLERIANKVKQRDLACTCVVKKDYSVGMIDVDLLLEIEADLIVMGTKGHSVIEQLLVGSTTVELMKRARKPLLIIKKKPVGDITDVVMGTNFENLPNIVNKQIKWALHEFGLNLHLVYVHLPGAIGFRSSALAFEDAKKFMQKNHFENASFHLINDYSEDQGILFAAKEQQAQMIFIPTHARSGFQKFFTGSVAEDMVENSHLPVMIFNMKADD